VSTGGDESGGSIPTDTESMPADDTTATTTSEPEPPEPRLVVDEAGTGDYETLQEAYRVAESGDTIAIRSGSYEVAFGGDDLDIDKSVTLVGAGRTETTVAIDGPQQEISMSDNAVDYWRMTVEPLRENGFVYADAEWSLYYTTYNVPTRGWKGGAQTGTELTAYESVFDADPIDRDAVNGVREDLADVALKIGVLDAKGCEFERPVDVQEVSVSDSRFRAQPRFRDTASSFSGGEITGSTFQNGLEIADGSADGFTIRNSKIASDAEGVAVTATSGGATSEVLGSIVRGRIVDDGEFGLARLEGNVFRADGFDGDFFIDGYGADRIHVNAFVGADIRVDSGEPTVFDADRELGNYYSTFDEPDEDGDGIRDLPRPIPGDGELTDQYPLASDDLSGY
jgi:hypothetical protein